MCECVVMGAKKIPMIDLERDYAWQTVRDVKRRFGEQREASKISFRSYGVVNVRCISIVISLDVLLMTPYKGFDFWGRGGVRKMANGFSILL
jgi:hypothetical protein